MIKYVVVESQRLKEDILLTLHKDLNYLFLDTRKQAIDLYFEMAKCLCIEINKNDVENIFIVKLYISDDLESCKILKTYELKNYLSLLD